MKILILNYEFPPIGGGGGKISEDLAKEYAKSNDVAVLTSWFPGEKKFEARDGIKIYRANVFRGKKSSCTIFEMFVYLTLSIIPAIKLVREFKPDIINCHFAVPVGPLAYIIYKIFGIRYVINSHGGDIPDWLPEQTGTTFRYIKWLTKPIWNNAAIVINNSKGTEDLARKSYPNANLTNIRNGIDLGSLAEQKRGHTKNTHNAVKLISVGRVAAQKDFGYLIGALAILKQRNINFYCEIIGDGPLRGEVEKRITNEHLENDVKITGWLPHNQVFGRLLDADIYVSSSTNEGMSIAMLEAMAAGLPVVATDVLGNHETVRDGITGFLVPRISSDLLAEAFIKLINDKDLYLKFSKNAEEIIKNYSREAVAAEHLAVFKEVLQKCRK